MEKTEPVTGLADTREQLSRMLIRRPRDPLTSGQNGSFPRSMVMRFLMDPRKRVYWIAGAATAAVLFPTISRAGKLGALATLATRVTRLLSQGRR